MFFGTLEIYLLSKLTIVVYSITFIEIFFTTFINKNEKTLKNYGGYLV